MGGAGTDFSDRRTANDIADEPCGRHRPGAAPVRADQSMFDPNTDNGPIVQTHNDSNSARRCERSRPGLTIDQSRRRHRAGGSLSLTPTLEVAPWPPSHRLLLSRRWSRVFGWKICLRPRPRCRCRTRRQRNLTKRCRTPLRPLPMRTASAAEDHIRFDASVSPTISVGNEHPISAPEQDAVQHSLQATLDTIRHSLHEERDGSAGPIHAASAATGVALNDVQDASASSAPVVLES